MIGIFGGTIAGSGLLRGGMDCHSHLLPGVDDGFGDMVQSVEALLTLEKTGLSRLWLTPHIMEECPNETDGLRRKFRSLVSEYRGKSARPLELRLGAEYMMDSLFVSRLASGDLLPMFSGGHLLVETSYYSAPLGMSGMLSSIKEHGYIPILAHPERYAYMDIWDYCSLASGGTLLQLDLFSLFGSYGAEARRKANLLLYKGMYSLAGSDMHEKSQLRLLTRGRLPCGTLRHLRLLLEKQNERYAI